MKKKPYLRPDEVAWKLSVSKRTIYRLIQSGTLIAFPIMPGGSIRIPRESFEGYIRKMTQDYQAEQGIIPQKTASGDDIR